MKKLVLLASGILLSLSSLTLTSCSKDEEDDDGNNNTPAPEVCRISGFNGNDGTKTTLYTVAYNSDGRISKLSTTTAADGTSTVNYTYAGNVSNVVYKNASGTVTSSATVTTNASGLVSSVIQKDAGGTITSTLTLEYNANGELTKFISDSGSGDPLIQTTAWSGGNIDKVFQEGAEVSDFDYYTDKPFQDGDYLKLQQIVGYGALYVKNKNLVKSTSSGSNISNFEYEFDSKGKIIKTTLTDGITTTTYSFDYTCE